MKFSLLLLVLLMSIASLTVRPQQSSFTVARIKPFDKAVPGQIMDVMIEGLGSGTTPIVFPVQDFKIEVSQDGITQTAKVRITKFTMIPETNTASASRKSVDFAGMKMRVYQAVSFVVPQGLHPGPAEVVVSFKGKRGNAIGMEILDKPLKPIAGTTSVMAAVSIPADGLPKNLEGNDFGWRLERGATAKVSVRPLVDPDDPNSAILIRFKQGGNDYDAVTRITTTPERAEAHGPGMAFFAQREELEVDVPAALTLGKADVEIRLKANGQVSDANTFVATITDVTRVAEAPAVSAPRLLTVTPKRVGAGQSIQISIDHRRTLEPSPKETQVVIEQGNIRYFATIEENSALFGPGNEPDAPVGLFVRTSRQIIGRAQIRVLNPLRGEQTGMSAPVSLEIVDEVLSPALIGVNESTEADLARMKQIYETQQQEGRDFPVYDPNSRYLTVRALGIDYNPKFVRVTLEQGDQKFTLTPRDFSFYVIDGLVIKMPQGLTGGSVKLTIENSDGEQYSTPVTKDFVLASRQ